MLLRRFFPVAFCALIVVLLAGISTASADRKKVKPRAHPEDEAAQQHLLRPSATDQDGNPILSYPGRAPHSLKHDPGNHPLTHATILSVTTVAGYAFYLTAAGIGALAFCGNWSRWADEIFTRTKCGVGSMIIGGLGVWGGVSIASAYLHGYYYNGNRIEAVALTGLGTLAGGGAAAGVWALTKNRWVVGISTTILPMLGAILFAELAAHDGTTEAFNPTSSKATFDVLVTDSMVGAGVHGSF